MNDKVPNLFNYENFIKSENISIVFIFIFRNFRMEEEIKFEAGPEKNIGTHSQTPKYH